MAVSVGGVTCDFVHNLDDTQQAKSRVDVYAVPGYPGLGAVVHGASLTSYRFEALRFESHANVTTWQALLEAMQGTIQTVVDDYGDTYASLFLFRVGRSFRRRSKKAIVVPGSPTVNRRASLLIRAVRLNN